MAGAPSSAAMPRRARPPGTASERGSGAASEAVSGTASAPTCGRSTGARRTNWRGGCRTSRATWPAMRCTAWAGRAPGCRTFSWVRRGRSRSSPRSNSTFSPFPRCARSACAASTGPARRWPRCRRSSPSNRRRWNCSTRPCSGWPRRCRASSGCCGNSGRTGAARRATSSSSSSRGTIRSASPPPSRRLESALGGIAVGVVRAESPAFQARIWAMRKAGLSISMSQPADRKPLAFIEDCAIPLERLPEWYRRLTEIIDRHATHAVWYAHASVGCLHVRPALDLRDGDDVERLRAIAVDAFALAAELDGSHSGEHGDGWIRSEFLEPMLGARLVSAFGEIKRRFDPGDRLNPGKIVDPPRMNDPSLLRARYGLETRKLPTALDWGSVGRVLAGRRHVQQQRDLPQAKPRGDVPVLPRHERRTAFDARARQRPAAGAVGAVGGRPVDVAGAVRGDGPLPGLQGVPPRVSDGRGHGAHEGGVPAPPARRAAALAAGPGARLSAPLRAAAFSRGSAREPAEPNPRARPPRRACGGSGGRPAAPPLVVAAVLPARPAVFPALPALRPGEWRAEGRALRRHLHALLRAGKRPRRRSGAGAGGLSGGGGRHRGPAALLRAHLPQRGPGRGGAGRTRPHRPRAEPLRGAGDPRGGTRTVMPPHAARRTARPGLRARGGRSRGPGPAADRMARRSGGARPA